jgi:hypothetical protein
LRRFRKQVLELVMAKGEPSPIGPASIAATYL